MQFITDALVAVLTAYLALTNTLADGISGLIPGEPEAPQQEVAANGETEEQDEMARIDSEYERGGALPSILIENATYQGAAVAGSAPATSTPTANIADALVNIFCTYETSEYVRSNSGSGFFINDDGVILTNAHVAQFLLLENVAEGSSHCVIRTNTEDGEYRAELLYISPAWIEKHAHLIDDEQPLGTGERDFALLYVTAGVDNQPLPARFPYLAVNTDLLSKRRIGDTVTVGGFPAGAFFQNGETEAIVPVTATTTLTDMFTFGSNYADVISIGSSTAGERGVSGGPVIDEAGEVIGMVSTKGSLEPGALTLRALTLSYIDRAMTEESTFTLHETASGQLSFRAQLFMDTIVPFLSRILESELE